jgi:LPS export ABC transporter protein LptC
MKKTGKRLPWRHGLLPVLLVVLFSCSFDYGNKGEEENDQPDLIMEKVEYVRIRGGDPMVRFQAELAERYEARQIMHLKEFSFEQFENHGKEVNSWGNAGEASVELDSGNIQLSSGVRILVDSEDITILTDILRWQDKEKQLSGSPTGRVDIRRSDGTSFSGQGFSADARARTWVFDSGVTGVYVDSDDEPEETEIVFEYEEAPER